MNALGSQVRIGADILRIDRLGGRLDSAFLRRTFTQRELDAGSSRGDSVTYLAKLFCGKEAVFKCLGMSACELQSWTDIEVVDDEHGRPTVRLHGRPAARAESLGLGDVELSLSYDTDYVLAVAATLGAEAQ